MSTQLLTEALDNCIDRLATGQTIEQCLEAYPDFADELRPLLQIGLASRQNRADALELSQMRSRLDRQMETLIANTDFDAPTPYRLPQGVLVLIVSMVLVVIGGLALFLGEGEPVGGQLTETATITPEITIEATATIVTPTETATITSEITIEATVTIVAPTDLPETSDVSLCTLPDGWQEYRIRSGDTLSGIALNSGATISELREVNCLADNQFIIEGQLLFVPKLWEINNNDNSSNDSNNNTSNSNSNNNDDDDDNNDDDDDDDDDDDNDDDDDDDD